MERFVHKTLVTEPLQLKYSYYLSPKFHDNVKQRPDIPVLLFCHGYPDDACWLSHKRNSERRLMQITDMWESAVPSIVKQRYPMVLIDILGLGHSDKPLDPSCFRYKQQADSLAQILDHESVKNPIVPIGHDWYVLRQPFVVRELKCRPGAPQYARGSICGTENDAWAWCSCLWIPTDQKFDLEEQNKATAGRFGYPQWEYWNFFTSPDGAEIQDQNLARMYDVNHGLYRSHVPGEEERDIWMREMFCTIGAMRLMLPMREYVARQGKYENFTCELKPYARDPELKRRFIERMKKDSFASPNNYYHSLKDDYNLEDERQLSEEDKQIRIPLLYIGQTGDWVCRTDLMSDAKGAGLIKNDLEEKVIDAGHWFLYEKPQEFSELVIDWLGRKFSVSG
ncbi:uncharacterized protein LTR77_001247 [Saxophila tyrrhenica]|uniref:AB hydrolase-1 domain-containing protein n=1 Tax=Saxophila tyrrhenica TaxID=1690608 RepID=A0AAV9PLK1_9PEZI|nr:hypothetical protein LTR77_001247 [Saxophila tyrrhenica]